MMIPVHGEASRLSFNAPSRACCNCGSPQDLQLLDTKLKHTRFMLLGGSETTLTMALPFCTACKASAKRFRQGYFSRALVALIVFWVLLGMMMVFSEHLPRIAQDNLLSTAALASAVLTTLFYVSRRAHPPATSYYQPVFLRKLKQTFLGEIQVVTLAFTNPVYADQFAQMNASFCGSGALVVEKY
jgi:hypothetical protein